MLTFVLGKRIMGQDKEKDRYDVKTKYHNNFLTDGYSAEIRDNKSGKIHKGSGSTPEKARDDAWKRAKRYS